MGTLGAKGGSGEGGGRMANPQACLDGAGWHLPLKEKQFDMLGHFAGFQEKGCLVSVLGPLFIIGFWFRV